MIEQGIMHCVFKCDADENGNELWADFKAGTIVDLREFQQAFPNGFDAVLITFEPDAN